MEMTTTLINNHLVKITVQKNQKGINHKVLKQMLKIYSFNMLGGEQLKTRYIYHMKTRNKPLAVVSCSNIFTAVYSLMSTTELTVEDIETMGDIAEKYLLEKGLLVKEAHKEGENRHE